MAVYNKDRRIDADCWYPIGGVLPYAGVAIPDGWLLCDGSEYSSTAEEGKYKELYDVIGTIYGVGSAADSFKVPDCRARFVEGASASYGIGQKIDPKIPAHSHSFSGTAVNSTSAGSHKHTRNTLNFTGNAYCDSNGNTLGTHTGAFSGSVCSGGCGSKDWNCSYGVANVCLKASDNWSGATSEVGTHYHSITAKGTLDNASAHNSTYGKSTTVQPASVCLNYIIRYK